MRTSRIITCLIALALLLPAGLQGQEPIADHSGQTVAAASQDNVQDARDRLHLLLLRPDVRKVARAQDIDLRPLHAGIDELPASALARIAPHARAVESAESQSAITISTATIIIVLLVVILVLLID